MFHRLTFEADVDIGRSGIAARIGIARRGPGLIVVKGNLRRGADLGELNVGHGLPGLERPAGQLLALKRQRVDIDGDRGAGTGVELVRGTAAVGPVIRGQIGRQIVQRAHHRRRRRRSLFGHAQLIGAGAGGIAPAQHEIGARGRRGEDDQGFGAEPAIVIAVQIDAIRVLMAKTCNYLAMLRLLVSISIY